MPDPAGFTFDRGMRRFRDGRGRFVKPGAVRAGIDAMAAGAGAEMRAVSEKLQSGEINASEWEIRMRAVIKAAHVAAGTIALGGKSGLDPRGMAQIANAVKAQYSYLRAFGREISAGLPLDGHFIARAAMYGQAARSTYENIGRARDVEAGYDEERRVIGGPRPCRGCIREAAKGWRPAGELLPIGSCECLTGCHCSFQRRKSKAVTMGNPVDDTDSWSPAVAFGRGGSARASAKSANPAKSGKGKDKAAPKSAAKLHGAGNCGTGKGGFKPGNTCGKSGRQKLAADLRAARKNADAHGGHAALRDKAKALKMHRRGHDHAVADEHAGQLRAGLRTGKDARRAKTKAETVAHAHAEVRAAHAAQRARNAKDAARKPVYESPRPESSSARYHRQNLEFYAKKKAEDEKVVRDRGPEYDKAKAKLYKLEDSAFDPQVTAKTREARAKKYEETKRELNEKYRDVIKAKSEIAGHDLWIERSRKGLEKARAEDAAKGPDVYRYADHQKANPDLIAPGPITDRIAKYRVGEAKIKAIKDIDRHYEVKDAELKADLAGHRKEVDRHTNDYLDASDRKDVVAKEKASRAVDEAADRVRNTLDEYRALASRKQADIESVIAVDRPARFEADDIRPGVSTSAGPLSPPSPDTRKMIDKAHGFLGKTVARGDGDVVRVQIGEGPGYRAHYHSGEGPGHATDPSHIQVRDGEQPTIIVHEYGHALDHQASIGGHSLNERTQEFLKHRVGDEVAIDMHEKFKAGDPGEMGRSDKFKAAMGDDYSAHYAGKDYNGHASEILSMGMEKMHLDPARFVARDPEYAKYVLGAMDGSLR